MIDTEVQEVTRKPNSPFTDEEIINLCTDSNNKRVKQLYDVYNGKWENYEQFLTKCDADIYFCSLMANLTDKDTKQINRIYIQSKLYDKNVWEKQEDDGTTYGQSTIEKAVNGYDYFINKYQSNDEDISYDIELETNSKNKTMQTIDNCSRVFDNDIHLKGKFRRNKLTYSNVVVGGVPWNRNKKERPYSNDDNAQLLRYFERYSIYKEQKIFSALDIATSENSFNPICDFLNSLVWDNKPHIENLLPDFLGVEKNEYSIQCMKLLMLGAISRAFNPGTKFDYMPVLVGGQGLGKSTFFKLLCFNEEWYNDNLNTIDGDKAFEKIRGMWIVELAELLATKKAKDIESIKAFLTSTTDHYREPYARIADQRPRTCVFVGTTNSDFFLVDRTGNRRFLPIQINTHKPPKELLKHIDEAKKEIYLAWAECMHIYKSKNFSLVMPQELDEYIKNVQNEHLEEDSRIGIIQNYLDTCIEEPIMCVPKIWIEALHRPNEPNRHEATEIHSIMKNSITGWKRMDKKRRFSPYGPQWGYERCSKN